MGLVAVLAGRDQVRIMVSQDPSSNRAADHPSESASIPSSAPSKVPPVRFKRPVTPRRSISPQAGRAIEILAHAIEYLTDELVNRGDLPSAGDPQLRAIQMLMELNRQIYYECPIAPSFGERIRAFLG